MDRQIIQKQRELVQHAKHQQQGTRQQDDVDELLHAGGSDEQFNSLLQGQNQRQALGQTHQPRTAGDGVEDRHDDRQDKNQQQ